MIWLSSIGEPVTKLKSYKYSDLHETHLYIFLPVFCRSEQNWPMLRDGTDSLLLTELRSALLALELDESAVRIELFLLLLLCVAVRLHSGEKRLRGKTEMPVK